jgi:hypothetical protein
LLGVWPSFWNGLLWFQIVRQDKPSRRDPYVRLRLELAPNNMKCEEVSLAHMVREVDIQPSHPGSSPHGCRFGFVL